MLLGVGAEGQRKQYSRRIKGHGCGSISTQGVDFAHATWLGVPIPSPMKTMTSQRAFSHSAGTAPIITLFIPETPLKTNHLHDPFKTASAGCGIQHPGTCGKHQTKTKNPSCISRGCRVQNSAPGTRGYWC